MMDERDAKLTHVQSLLRVRSLSFLLSLTLVACATTRNREAAPAPPPVAKATAPDSGTALSSAPEKPPESKLFKGTGVLVEGQEEGGEVPGLPRPPVPPGPAVTLNFESADIREVVRNILGDILNESY